jgi:hypothetical protein
MSAVCLSLHADYVCRRSGPCCTSGWPVDVESDRLGAWREALAAGRLSFRTDNRGDDAPYVVPPDLPPGAGAVLQPRASGACVFYREDDGLCAVHCGLGHSALPAACQHFPRRCLIEPDRVAVSRSHYCPTVARLAFRTDLAPAVVPAPYALVGHLALEGLDAREALPPLLRPDVIADRETFRAWEEVALGMLALDIAPESALARISAFAEALRTWNPADGCLRERLESLVPAILGGGAVFPDDDSGFQCGRSEEPIRSLRDTRAESYALVCAAVPERLAVKPVPPDLGDLDAGLVAPAWAAFSRPIRQFLAAHAFGNWCAYNGRGLRTVVRSLDLALEVVRVEATRACAEAARTLDQALLIEAFRAADLLLVHLADPVVLGQTLSEVEGPSRRP